MNIKTDKIIALIALAFGAASLLSIPITGGTEFVGISWPQRLPCGSCW